MNHRMRNHLLFRFQRAVASETNRILARLSNSENKAKFINKSLSLRASNAEASVDALRLDSARLNEDVVRGAFRNTLFTSISALRKKTGDPDFEFERLICALGPKASGQLFQDVWALHETNMLEAGFFVEFGAMDGLTLSNSLLLETDFGWKGILAEPNPNLSSKINENRTAIVDHRCVAPVSGETVELVITKDPEFSSTVETNIQSIETERRVAVPTVSLSDLLDEHNAPDVVDFLSIDTEGGEYDTLAAYGFGRDKRPIRLIAVEHNYQTEKRRKIFDLLSSAGYRRCFTAYSQFDDWYRLDET